MPEGGSPGQRGCLAGMLGSAATRASGRMGRRDRKVRVFMGRWIGIGRKQDADSIAVCLYRGFGDLGVLRGMEGCYP